MTDHSTPAWYEASFSPQAGFYLVSYRGPGVPWQSVLKSGVDREGRMCFFYDTSKFDPTRNFQTSNIN